MISKAQRKKISQFSVVSFTIAILITILSEIIFDDLKSGILAGFVVVGVGATIELKEVIESHKLASDDAIERVVTLLNLHNDYFNEVHLFEMLNMIVSIRRLAGNKRLDLQRFDRIIANALDKAKAEIGSAFRLHTGDDELERIIRLKDAVTYAEDYVYALTYDDNDYLNKFWTGVFGQEYIDSNLEASERGVDVKRVFVVDQKIIDNENLDLESSRKRQRLLAVSTALKNCKSCKVYWVGKERLPDTLKESNTSFLICDDHIGSESNGAFNSRQVAGYVSYGDKRNVIEPLKDRFERLRRYAEEMS